MLKKLRAFLVRAKLATYAGGGEERVLDDGCKELLFEDGALRYRDRYYGFNPFVGEELVWWDDKRIWVMNYFGKIFPPPSLSAVSEKEVYRFLKNALRKVTEARPFRGPSYFQEDEFQYADDFVGGIDFFSGLERILHKGKERYHLYYHGGLL